MNLTEITRAQFQAHSSLCKVIEHAHAQRFALVRLGDQREVAISWRSNLVDPVLIADDANNTWLGIDDHVVCIAPAPAVIFSIGLASRLLDIRVFAGCVAVLCETELTVVNTVGYSIREMHGLSDIPEALEFTGQSFQVTFVNGDVQEF